MFRVLFLLLVVLSSVAFAQTEETPKAVKFEEFEKATNGYVKMKMDYFYTELNNNPQSDGYIINYGTDREITIREKQIRVAINWRKYDASRVTIVRGGFRDGVKTEFWMVPPGAENPAPNSTGEKIDEFGKTPDDDLRARLQSFYGSLANNPNSKGFILIYGSPKVIASQTARLQKFIENYKFNSSLLTFKDAGFDKGVRTEFWRLPSQIKNKLKTEIWIVPPGAKPPIQ